jgi:thiol-disulfide isomerase/thioredoxin
MAKDQPPDDQTSLVVAVLSAALSTYLIPATYILFRRIFCAPVTLSLKKQRIQRKQESCYTSTKLHLPLTLFLWILAMIMISSVPENSAPMNPYDILELNYGEQSKREIKKAYRAMSLQYHPDKIKDKSMKTKNELDAVNTKFIEISEAYRTLNDPTAYRNWQEYGHPDGSRWQRAAQDAPLPSFLLVDDVKGTTSTLTLTLYAVLIVLVPLGCICAASSEKRSNTLTDSDRKHYMQLLRSNRQQLNISVLLEWCSTAPTVLATGAEVSREWLSLNGIATVSSNIVSSLLAMMTVGMDSSIEARMQKQLKNLSSTATESDERVANSFQKKFDFTTLFGPTLTSKEGDIETLKILSDVEAIGVYFSAHWCGPCRAFTPKLSKQYTALKAAGKKVEIIFASSDQNDASFQEYYGEMPWLALPFDRRDLKKVLSSKYSIEGIPALIFLDAKTGETLATNGRGEITSSAFINNFPYRSNTMAAASGDDQFSVVVQASYYLHTSSETKAASSDVLKKSSSKNNTLTMDVVVVGPIIAASRESLACLLSIAANPQSNMPAEYCRLIAEGLSYLCHDEISKNSKDYVLAVSAKVIEMFDPIGDTGGGQKMNDVRVNDVLTVTVGLSKKVAPSSSSSTTLYVGPDKDEEDR